MFRSFALAAPVAAAALVLTAGAAQARERARVSL